MSHWTDPHIEYIEEPWHGYPGFFIGYDECGQELVRSSHRDEVVSNLISYSKYLETQNEGISIDQWPQ